MGLKGKKISSLLSVSILVVFIIGFGILQLMQVGFGSADIAIEGRALHVLVAKTPKQLNRGLGQRDALVDADGMLLVFGSSGRHGIVMREMRFPIDIIWIDRGTIVDIAPHVAIEPGKEEQYLTPYFPRADANLVLELPAGKAAEYGLRVGDRVELR